MPVCDVSSSVIGVLFVISDYNTYRIMLAKNETGEPGEFTYAIFDDQGGLNKVDLSYAYGKRDPLCGIANLQLRLDGDQKHIIGIIVEDECVLRSEFAKKKEEPPAEANEDAPSPQENGTTEEGEEKADPQNTEESTDDKKNVSGDVITAPGEVIESCQEIKPSTPDTEKEEKIENNNVEEKRQQPEERLPERPVDSNPYRRWSVRKSLSREEERNEFVRRPSREVPAVNHGYRRISSTSTPEIKEKTPPPEIKEKEKTPPPQESSSSEEEDEEEEEESSASEGEEVTEQEPAALDTEQKECQVFSDVIQVTVQQEHQEHQFTVISTT